MANILNVTASTWSAFVKAFQDDLAVRVERSLDKQTTLGALDLTPACHPAGNNNQHGQPRRPQQRQALPTAEPSKFAPAGKPHAGCAARTLSRLDEAPAPGPSPDGVLSPVSPPSSRRSSLSALSAGGLAVATSDLRLTSESSSALSEPTIAAATTTSGSAAAAGAAAVGSSSSSSSKATASSGRRDAAARPRPSVAIHVDAQSSQRTASRCQTQPQPAASGAALAQAPGAAEAAAAEDSTAAAAGPAVVAAGPQGLRLPQRRSATLRLRCIVRDPVTGSMLATARGHVDDPDIPLRRPRGRLRPEPAPARADAGAGAAAAGEEGGSRPQYEVPGHLLFIEEQVLGRGAFGFVTLVTDAITERAYALKRLRRSAVSPKHVMQEQQALRLLMRDQLAAAAPGCGAHPHADPSQQQQPQPWNASLEERGGTCSRCGGVTGPEPRAQASFTAGSGPSASSIASAVASGRSGTQRVGSGRCAAAAAAAAAGGGGLQPQRPCQCRFCTSGVAAAGAGASAAPTMGAARTAWLAKQKARGLLGWQLPQQQQQQRTAAQPVSAAQRQYRQQQAQGAEPVRRCCCRPRRGPSFCVRQLGTFQDEQYLYLLMEHCPGGDLDRLVRSMARKTLVPRASWLAQVVMGPAVAWRGLPEAAARFYAAGMLLALEELHSHFIVYRDLKPGNVLIDGAGYPRLADFGMAKVLGGPTGRATSACGTLDYMAPEIVKLECEQLAREGRGQGLENWVDSAVLRGGPEAAAGEADAGRGGRGPGGAAAGQGRRRRLDAGQASYGLGVDWWSYGAVLYVLLTGCKPFCPPEAEEAGEDPTRVLVRIINPWYEVPLPVFLSPAARDLLKKLLVRQPRWRLGCGGGGAEEVRRHPFFAGFDWDAFEERRMAPPFPVKAVSLPHDQEAESVACFFGFYGSSVADPSPRPATPGQQPAGPEGQGADARRRQQQPQQQQQHLAVSWLQDF